MAKIRADKRLVSYIESRREKTDEEIIDNFINTDEEIRKHRKTCRALSNMRAVATIEIASASLLAIAIVQNTSILVSVVSLGTISLYVYYNYLRLKYLDEGLESLRNKKVTIDDLKAIYKSKEAIGER